MTKMGLFKIKEDMLYYDDKLLFMGNKCNKSWDYLNVNSDTINYFKERAKERIDRNNKSIEKLNRENSICQELIAIDDSNIIK